MYMYWELYKLKLTSNVNNNYYLLLHLILSPLNIHTVETIRSWWTYRFSWTHLIYILCNGLQTYNIVPQYYNVK